MAHQNSFYGSANMNDQDATLSTFEPSGENHSGASSLEIKTVEIRKHEKLENEKIDDNDDFPMPPPCSPTFPTLCNDLFGSPTFSRRYSCLPTHLENPTDFYQRSRAPSLPGLGAVGQADRLSHETNFKKLLFDTSRRSSYESAYHSHRSDFSLKTPITSSQIEDLEYSHDFSDRIFNITSQSLLEDISINENLERNILERRNSLSYEAIRTYFLEFNPYMNTHEPESLCWEHRNDEYSSLFCPHCDQRRNSIDQPNSHFRTMAHRQVVERQFEDLFYFPDARYSRSTSLDIFGGIGIPFTIQEQNDVEKELLKEEENICDDESSNK